MHVYIDIRAGGSPDLAGVLSSQEAYVRESLGVPLQPAAAAPAGEAELAREEHELGGEEGKAEFTLLLTRPAGSGGSGGGGGAADALAAQLRQQAQV